MTTHQQSSLSSVLNDPANIRLGDLLVFGDNTTYGVRAKASFDQPLLGAYGFMVLGEMSKMLVPPQRRGQPYGLYVPYANLAAPKGLELYAEGVTRYWPAHLPAQSSAMPDIGFRVLAGDHDVHPTIVLFRSSEPVPFVRIGLMDPAELSLIRMPDDEQTGNASRESWGIAPVTIPASQRTAESRRLVSK